MSLMLWQRAVPAAAALLLCLTGGARAEFSNAELIGAVSGRVVGIGAACQLDKDRVLGLTKRAFAEVNRRAVSKGDAGSATSLFAEAFNAGSAEIDAGTTSCAAGKKALEDVDRMLPR
jgi:hypothetical protein